MKATSRVTAPPILALALFAFVAAPGMLLAQGVPLGPEFRVNSYTTDTQNDPSIASDSAGNFIIGWLSVNQDGSVGGVFAQRYASTGNPLGGEFRVNTYTTGVQGSPSVAANSAGDFVVVWHSFQDGGGFGIFGQRYASSGAPLGGEFRINTYTTNLQQNPSAASDSAGNFVVVWDSVGQDYGGYGIVSQRYSSTGSPQGGEVVLTSGPNSNQDQRFPAVDRDSAGNFVVVWQGYSLAEFDGIHGQRFSSAGAPLGNLFRVNTYVTGSQYRPAVASDSTGNFVVAWESGHEGGAIFAQRYASSGMPLGGEFRVNTFTVNFQGFSSLAADSAGNFVVAWHSVLQDGSSFGVFAQRYASSGAPLGGEFRVNTYTTSGQLAPSVASDPGGNFVIAWGSGTQDSSGYGVFAQRYNMIVPVELQDFRVE